MKKAASIALTFGLLWLAALSAGCSRSRGGNCRKSDCQTDADCPGNWVCEAHLILGRVCIEPSAQECLLGSFGASATLLSPVESVGPVVPLEDPATCEQVAVGAQAGQIVEASCESPTRE